MVLLSRCLVGEFYENSICENNRLVDTDYIVLSHKTITSQTEIEIKATGQISGIFAQSQGRSPNQV